MAEWQRICPLAGITEGEPRAAEVKTALGAEPIVLVRQGEHCYALHDICTHAYARLSTGFVDGNLIFCPLHAASFDVTNGKCVDAPAEEDLRTYPVKIEAGEVWVKDGEG